MQTKAKLDTKNRLCCFCRRWYTWPPIYAKADVRHLHGMCSDKCCEAQEMYNERMGK